LIPSWEKEVMKTILVAVACFVTVFCASGALPTGLISGSQRPSATGGGGSFQPAASADGRFIAFTSQANNLVTNDSLLPYLDVFLRDRVSGVTILVSISTNGTGGGDNNSVGATVSADGRYVAFESTASNLAAGDTNGVSDVYLRDLVANVTLLVSRDLDGNASVSRPSTAPILSTNGLWIVFESSATNLVANDTNGAADIFAFNRPAGTNVLVSVNDAGTGSREGASFSPNMTPDGRLVAFVNFTSNTMPAQGHVYVRDLQTRTTTWASSDAMAELPGYIGALNPVLSSDGHAIFFHAYSAAQTNLYRLDLQSLQNTLVSVEAQARSAPSSSGDGRLVAYERTNLVYVWDAQMGSDALVSVSRDGLPVPFSEGPARPVLTSDGTKVLFLSNGGDLSVEPTNALTQLYLRDLAAGMTILVSADTNGAAAGDLAAIVPALSADGRHAAFESGAATMTPEDLNLASDVFLRGVDAGLTELISLRHGSLPSITAPALATLYPNSISADGRYVAYGSLDKWNFPGDTNGVQDIFVRDRANGTEQAVSVSSSGEFTNTLHSFNCVLSADGRHVTYVLGEQFGFQEATTILWHDLQSGQTRAISEPPGSGPWALSIAPAISAEGRWVAFQTTKSARWFETNISDGNSTSDIILHDATAGTNQVISRNIANPSFTAGGASTSPILSSDARWLAYANKDSATTPGFVLYLRDRLSNTTTAVNLAVPVPPGSSPLRYDSGVTFSSDSRSLVFTAFPAFSPGLKQVVVYDLLNRTSKVVCTYCRKPSLNADGRFVVVENNSPAASHASILLYDLATGAQNLISVEPIFLAVGNGDSYSPITGGDGRFVLFTSRATNLDPADTSFETTLYVRDRFRNTTTALPFGLTTRLGNGMPYTPAMAANGRTVVFSSFASDLVSGDYNDRRDLFVLEFSADTDRDDLDDDWEVAYFGNLSRDGSGDFDGDGQSDRQEFISGTDPANSESVLRVYRLTSVQGGSVTIFWHAVPLRTYLVQYKDDLAAEWSTLRGQVTATSTTAIRVDTTVAASKVRFYRVLLTP
jgi:Tol biopolymer transport system component